MGPLKGITVLEIASIGPGPFCGMMLADMGATVIRVDRYVEETPTTPNTDVLARNRQSISVDLKKPEGIELVLKLCRQSDALIEGFRPGVAERLGIGPEACMKINPKLVYGRMTGWGQEGPLAHAAGHDINYIALSGALHGIGLKDGPPIPPLNLVGDFGGGAMMLAFGLVCALLEASNSQKGQVIDAAMIDGSAVLMSLFYWLRTVGMHGDDKGNQLLDGGAHFYGNYATKDNKFISIGSIEPQFYQLLIKLVDLDKDYFSEQMNKKRWPEYKAKLTEIFKTKTQKEWCELLEGTDVCFAPILSLSEAPKHPHNVARKNFLEIDGLLQPAPAPRFSRTQPEVKTGPKAIGSDTEQILLQYGFTKDEIKDLVANKIVNR